MHAVISLSHTMHRNSYWKIAYTVEWAIVFQFDSLSTDINLVCSCALVVVWSATFPKLSLVSSNVIVMLASKLVSTRAANEEEEDPHPRGFWLILLPHSPGNEIFDSSYSSFLEE